MPLGRESLRQRRRKSPKLNQPVTAIVTLMVMLSSSKNWLHLDISDFSWSDDLLTLLFISIFFINSQHSIIFVLYFFLYYINLSLLCRWFVTISVLPWVKLRQWWWAHLHEMKSLSITVKYFSIQDTMIWSVEIQLSCPKQRKLLPASKGKQLLREDLAP